MFLRLLAKHWPDDYELAMTHHDVMHPEDDNDKDDKNTFPEIQFGTCRHCTLPWPLTESGALIDHPQFDEPRATCPGSHTHDFLEFE